MDKKKIDIQENIIETENVLPEDANQLKETVKITYKAKKSDEKEDFADEQAREVEEEFFSKKHMKSKHKRRVAIGVVMCLLMLIGVLSIISSGVGFAAKLLDNTAEKEKYNAMLATLVVADPLPFETPDQADQTLLLSSSVWAAVMNEDMEQYEKDDFGQTYLPAVEVDKYFTRVFGTQYALTHQSFAEQEIEFTYDEAKQAYIVPVTSFPTGFTPQVEKIKTGGGEKIVTVGYISPATNWNDDASGAVSKYVDYIFQKQGSEYYLVAIRESEMQVEVAVTEPEAQQ
ncbi:MAG: hypothetical protein IJW74_06330 [Oscillospiraceae bacterium]|nr:hypothetical protein [Oscillospiraceae bacterium]